MARELAIENGKLKSDLDANGKKVANLATPTQDGDAATKKYVDENSGVASSWGNITGKPSWIGDTKPTYTAPEVGADESGAASTAVSNHNASPSAHADQFAAKLDADDPVLTPTAPSVAASDTALAGAKLTAQQLSTKQDAIQQLTAALVAWLAAFKGNDTATTLASVIAAINGKLDKSGGTIDGELFVSDEFVVNGDAIFNGDITASKSLTASYLDAYLGFKFHGVPFYFPATSGTVVVWQDLNGFLRDDTAEYDEDSTYEIGEFVKHNGSIYICKTAITTAEAWTSAHWTEMPNVAALFGSGNTALTARVNALIEATVGDINDALDELNGEVA